MEGQNYFIFVFEYLLQIFILILNLFYDRATPAAGQNIASFLYEQLRSQRYECRKSHILLNSYHINFKTLKNKNKVKSTFLASQQHCALHNRVKRQKKTIKNK